MKEISPIVKYIGGKSRLAPSILAHRPAKFSSYFEPFVGGGAIFCSLWNDGLLSGKHVHLNDLNSDVIDLYRVVRDLPAQLMMELKELRDEYASSSVEERSVMYYRERTAWNTEGGHKPSRYVFLKQTSFNGLWRVNQKGEFNGAWGKYTAPKILDEDNILGWHTALQHTHLTSENALDVDVIPSSMFAYLDPPYLGTFDGYTDDGFDYVAHAKLLGLMWSWVQQGASLLYSNSMAAAPLASIACPIEQRHVTTSYTVNRDGAGRVPVDELLLVHKSILETPKKRTRTGVTHV